MKKMFIEGNQIQDFMSSSGSGTVINYGSGSGSTSQKVTVPTVPVPVPVPQHCLAQNIHFLILIQVQLQDYLLQKIFRMEFGFRSYFC